MLPLIAGIVVGAVAVVAVNNRKEIKEKVIEGATIAKAKAIDVQKTVTTKVENLKNKKENTKEENTQIENEVKNA